MRTRSPAYCIICINLFANGTLCSKKELNLKKRADFLNYLKLKGRRMTALKELLIQFFLENQNRHVSRRELQEHLAHHLPEEGPQGYP